MIFWLLIRSWLSFSKLRINFEEGSIIGIKIKVSEHPTFEIDQAKAEKLLSNLRDFPLNKRITEQKLSYGRLAQQIRFLAEVHAPLSATIL